MSSYIDLRNNRPSCRRSIGWILVTSILALGPLASCALAAPAVEATTVSHACIWASTLEALRLPAYTDSEAEHERAEHQRAEHELTLTRIYDDRCSKAGLSVSHAKDWFTTLRERATTGASEASELVVNALEIVAALAVAWYAMLVAVGRMRWGKRALDLFPPSRRALGVQIIFEPFQDEAVTPKMGAGLVPLIRGQMRRRLPYSEQELDQVTGQSSIVEGLAGLSALSPQLGAAAAVWAMISGLLPRVRVTANGVLQPLVENQGWGLSLVVSNKDEFSGTTTLRSGPLGYGSGASRSAVESAASESAASGAFTRMAVPAAAWLDYKLAELAGTRVKTTGDALSYAYFRAALQWEREGDVSWAHLLYRSALHYDADNIGALSNLAVLELREGTDERGFARLLHALEVIEGREGNNAHGAAREVEP